MNKNGVACPPKGNDASPSSHKSPSATAANVHDSPGAATMSHTNTNSSTHSASAATGANPHNTAGYGAAHSGNGTGTGSTGGNNNNNYSHHTNNDGNSQLSVGGLGAGLGAYYLGRYAKVAKWALLAAALGAVAYYGWKWWSDSSRDDCNDLTPEDIAAAAAAAAARDVPDRVCLPNIRQPVPPRS